MSNFHLSRQFDPKIKTWKIPQIAKGGERKKMKASRKEK